MGGGTHESVGGGTHDTYVPTNNQLYRRWVVVRMIPTFRPRNSCIVAGTLGSPIQQQMHDKINCKKESYGLSSICGAPRNHTNVPPVDAHV